MLSFKVLESENTNKLEISLLDSDLAISRLAMSMCYFLVAVLILGHVCQMGLFPHFHAFIIAIKMGLLIQLLFYSVTTYTCIYILAQTHRHMHLD